MREARLPKDPRRARGLKGFVTSQRSLTLAGVATSQTAPTSPTSLSTSPWQMTSHRVPPSRRPRRANAAAASAASAAASAASAAAVASPRAAASFSSPDAIS